jgi:ATP-binding protein involved in chromosome partitioning
MFRRTNIDVLGLIENMSLHHCSQCGHQEAIFGSGGGQRLSDTLDIKLLGQLPLDSRIASLADEGIPIAGQSNHELAKPFIRAAMQSAISLAEKPLNYADRFPEIISE